MSNDRLKESLEDNEQGMELIVSEPETTALIPEGFLILSVKNIWGDFKYRVGTDDTTFGITLEPAKGMVALVAFPIQDGAVWTDELSKQYEGVISYEQLETVIRYRSRLEMASRQEKVDALNKKDGGF